MTTPPTTNARDIMDARGRASRTPHGRIIRRRVGRVAA